MKEATYTFDTRIHEIQHRKVREGNALLMQYRTIIHNLDGTKESGEWSTSGVITNYGDVVDNRPSLVDRIMSWFR